MKIVAIDLETTGLDPNTDMILEVGAVMFDPAQPDTPVNELPHFHRLVHWDHISGHPYALQMNVNLLRAIAGGVGTPIYKVTEDLKKWLGPGKVTPLGFNVAAFDIAFLKRYGLGDCFTYRPLELGSMFATRKGPARSDDLVLHYLGRPVPHSALQDARDAVSLWRVWCCDNGYLLNDA